MAELRRLLVTHGPTLGLAGVLVAFVASVLSALPYRGTAGERYQAVNHTVSELGERGVSEFAHLFNLGLIVSGLLIGAFMLGRALVAEDNAGRGFWVLGLLAAVAIVLVGIFPVDVLEPHIVVALAAFLLLLVASAWFAVWTLRGSAPFPRLLGWFAAWITLAMVLFFVLPAILQPQYEFEMEFTPQEPRPVLLLNSLLEWVVVLSSWLWIAAIAWHERTAQGDAA